MSKRRPFSTWTGTIDGLEKKPLKAMRIFAEGNTRRFFVEVYVWEHFWQVRALKTRSKRHTLAFWHSFDCPETKQDKDRLGRTITSKKLGEMHLCLKACTYNTIAHEAYHATRTFSRRSGHHEPTTGEEALKIKNITREEPEERNAYFHGYLTDKIIAGIYDLIAERNAARKARKRRSKQI